MAELLATVSSIELSEWMEFDRLEPFGDGRADLRAGIIASTVANYSGKTLKEDISLNPSDFMPYQERPKEACKDQAILDTDSEAQSALIMAAMFGIAPGE